MAHCLSREQSTLLIRSVLAEEEDSWMRFRRFPDLPPPRNNWTEERKWSLSSRWLLDFSRRPCLFPFSPSPHFLLISGGNHHSLLAGRRRLHDGTQNSGSDVDQPAARAHSVILASFVVFFFSFLCFLRVLNHSSFSFLVSSSHIGRNIPWVNFESGDNLQGQFLLR